MRAPRTVLHQSAFSPYSQFFPFPLVSFSYVKHYKMENIFFRWTNGGLMQNRDASEQYPLQQCGQLVKQFRVSEWFTNRTSWRIDKIALSVDHRRVVTKHCYISPYRGVHFGVWSHTVPKVSPQSDQVGSPTQKPETTSGWMTLTTVVRKTMQTTICIWMLDLKIDC